MLGQEELEEEGKIHWENINREVTDVVNNIGSMAEAITKESCS